MKNLKTIALGLLVGAMAIGFSAFTNAHSNGVKYNRDAKGQIISVTSSYFRLAADASTLTDTNPDDYKFSTGGACTSGTLNICHSEWTTDNTPTNGQSPSDAGSPTFVSDDTPKGVYNGD